MKRKILSTQTSHYERVFFVDWGQKPSTCRILLAGLGPSGYTTVQRNVISMQYNEAITSPIIRNKFSFVDKVYTILSDDLDFDDIVIAKGGQIVYPTCWSEPISAIESMKQYGDRHPDVKSPLKSPCPNEGITQQFILSPPKTTPQFFNAYHICWFLNDASRVIIRNHILLEGTGAIVTNSHLLHNHLTVINFPTPCNGLEYGLVCGAAAFFSDRKYKVCVWDDLTLRY